MLFHRITATAAALAGLGLRRMLGSAQMPLLATLVAGGVLLAGNASAVVVLSDNFDTEGSGTVLNFNAFTNWDVLNGAVDLIQSGDFSIDCVGGAGRCVDLAGTSISAGDLVSKTTFAAGAYTLRFDLSGNQRGASLNDEVTVTLGDLNESFTKAFDAPFETITRNLTIGGGGDKLTFSHAGFDFVGLILDNVILETRDAGDVGNAIPEPASLTLFGAGLAGLDLMMRRRRRSRRCSGRRLSPHPA